MRLVEIKTYFQFQSVIILSLDWIHLQEKSDKQINYMHSVQVNSLPPDKKQQKEAETMY